MSDFTRWVENQLKDGYSVARMPNGGLGVRFLTQKDFVTLPNGVTVRLTDNNGYHNRRRTLQHLRAAGVAKAGVSGHSSKTRTSARPMIKDPKTSFVLSMEVLRDPNATPRERRLARAYQETVKSNEELRTLAQRLALRLRELGE